MTNGTSALASFMASPLGRLLRVAMGVALIYWGWSMQTGTGTLIMIVGLLPLAAGAFNFCLIAPLIGAPFWGSKIRDGTSAKA